MDLCITTSKTTNVGSVKCRECGRQFVENGQQNQIRAETKQLIDKLLLEKIPLAGIARVLEISETWLQSYVNEVYESQRLEPPMAKRKGKLTIECDEMWSFVGDKNNKQWIWLAINKESREIVGFYTGRRNIKWSLGFMAVVAACLSSVCRLLH
jgi:insertion element IS1 protein InsB